MAAEDEAAELWAAAGGDLATLGDFLARRVTGEPLAWIVGSTTFCGETIVVHPGVYVPRWQSEPLALEARRRLTPGGVAVDLCTGAGPIPVALGCRQGFARVVGTDLDPAAVSCATANGVEAIECDLATALLPSLGGRVDLVTAVVPYVPSEELAHLPRDVLAHEPRRALDGGPGGTVLLGRAVAGAATLLRPGGSLLVELGGEQADALGPLLVGHGFGEIVVARDEDGDVRSLWCRRS